MNPICSSSLRLKEPNKFYAMKTYAIPMLLLNDHFIFQHHVKPLMILENVLLDQEMEMISFIVQIIFHRYNNIYFFTWFKWHDIS